MKQYNFRITLIISIVLLSCSSGVCQDTVPIRKHAFYEDSIIPNLMHSLFDIKKKLLKVISPVQRKHLLSVKFKIDTANTGLMINSNSNTNTITVGVGIIKAVARDQLAYDISMDAVSSPNILGIDLSPELRKPRFYDFYRRYLYQISDTINLLNEAELDEDEMDAVQNWEGSEKFRWDFQKRIIYIVLHEFGHQLQEYSAKAEKISSGNQSLDRQRAQLAKLEFQCDSFVYSVMPKLHLVPIYYTNIIQVLANLRENRIMTQSDMLRRKKLFIALNARNCKQLYKNSNIDCDALKREVEYADKDLRIEQRNYDKELSGYQKVTNREFVADPINCYVLGYAYLKGVGPMAKNIDSAKYYFMRASDICINTMGAGIDTNKLKSKTEKIAFELSSLIAGKILANDRNQDCYLYYKRSSMISIYFPKEEYYDRLLARTQKQFAIKDKKTTLPP
jgi:hypothetical protein